MSWKRWKALEKQVAKALGGQRRVRVSYSESVEDVIHDTYAIECKYGKQVPAYCRVKSPVVYYYPNGEAFLLFPEKDCWVMDDKDWHLPLKRRDCGFVKLGLTQARGYDPKKIPILCMKSPGMRGFVIGMYYMDWYSPKSPTT